MMILTITIKLHAPWVHSLKEKRMVVKSLLAKLQNKFNVSVAELDEQDIHQIIVLGLAGIVANNAQADSVSEAIQHFVDSNTEAELLEFDCEIR